MDVISHQMRKFKTENFQSFAQALFAKFRIKRASFFKKREKRRKKTKKVPKKSKKVLKMTQNVPVLAVIDLKVTLLVARKFFDRITGLGNLKNFKK